MMRRTFESTLRFIYCRPRLRLIYWFLRSPLSAYAAYCFAKERIARELLTDGQYLVLNGPYKGMKYTRHGSSILLPCLLGTYEMEIWPVIESLKSDNYDLIVDVGSAEGYHACGLAKITGTKVNAYDTSDSARYDCAEMAQLNEVTNSVTIKSFLTHEELESLCSSRKVFVFCDIDFAETDLLDLDKVPSLLNTDLLVETHGHREDGHEHTLPVILRRFEKTHDVTHFTMLPRFPHRMWDFVQEGTNHNFGIGRLTNEPLCFGFFESRGLNNWLWLKAKSKTSKV